MIGTRKKLEKYELAHTEFRNHLKQEREKNISCQNG